MANQILLRPLGFSAKGTSAPLGARRSLSLSMVPWKHKAWFAAHDADSLDATIINVPARYPEMIRDSIMALRDVASMAARGKVILGVVLGVAVEVIANQARIASPKDYFTAVVARLRTVPHLFHQNDTVLWHGGTVYISISVCRP